MKLSEIGADLELEEQGAWCPIRGDFEVKVCSASSKRARKAYRKYVQPVERRIAVGSIKEDEAVPYVVKYIVHGLLLDWRGAEDDDGKPVPYSAEVAEQTLRLPKMKHVRRDIQTFATEQENFRRLEMEDDAEALKGASAGSSKQENS